MLEDLLAKSNLGIKLVDHTKDVINVSMFLFDDGYVADYYPHRDDMRRCLALSAMFHDIGKCTEKEQNVLRNNAVCLRDKAPHNLVGERFILEYANMKVKDEIRHIAKMVRFHHVPIPSIIDDDGNEVFEKIELGEDDYLAMKTFAEEMGKYVSDTFEIPVNVDFIEFGNGEERAPITEFYEAINPLTTDCEKSLGWMIILKMLVKADRLVSSLYETADAETLRAITNNDKSVIGAVVRASETEFKGDPQKDLTGYNLEMDRYEKQEKIVKDIEDFFKNGVKTCIIQEDPGFGKTLCGFLLSVRHSGRVIWCAPTQALAKQTYDTLVDFKTTYHIEDKIGLFFSGQQQDGDENPKISVCVIDTYLSMERKNGNMIDFLETSKALLILDEYHEFECSEALFAAYYRLIYTRMLITGGNTVLISATPLIVGKQELLCCGAISEDCAKNLLREVCKPRGLNSDDEPDYGNENGYSRKRPKKVYNVRLVGIDSYSDIEPYLVNDSITVTSTVKDDQRIGELKDTLCLHARYTDSDRAKKFDELQMQYKKDSPIPKEKKIPVVMSPIAGTGIDISCHTMNMFITKPSDIIQYQGRLGRFDKEGSEKTNLNIIYFKDKSKDSASSETKARKIYTINPERRNDKAICIRIDKYFIDKLCELDGKEVSFDELCQFYDKFLLEQRKNITSVYNEHMKKAVQKLKEISFSRAHFKEEPTNEITLSSCQNFRGSGNQVYVTSKKLNNELMVLETDIISKDDLRDYVDVKETYKRYKAKGVNKYLLDRMLSKSQSYVRMPELLWSFAKKSDMPIVLDASKHSYSYKYGLSLKR